ncbi:hypothetical protein [Francisella tularensis]|nr:hypothetical protein [Francisella tularensis]MCF5906063.1 hypothetical protein [Francisella tularensis]MCH4980057.1 hypothetical protein [Francisella tularensis]MCH4981778.1 hypothetical protein [Francisella tularensis]MCH4983154.1 hypothetical protein [Francisella tularensis]MDN9008295.1 hypothetical protein [Francisella tularensis subsp. mediasiatica]
MILSEMELWHVILTKKGFVCLLRPQSIQLQHKFILTVQEQTRKSVF